MRAIFLHASADLYGSDRACLEVVDEAISRGWSVTVTVPGSGPLVDSLTRRGARVLDIDPLKPRRVDLKLRHLPTTLRSWWRSWLRIRRLAVDEHADIIYSTTAPTLAGFYLARRWRGAHIYHVHEIFWFPKVFVRAFERVIRRSDVIIHCSAAVRDQFRDEQLRERSTVIHTGSSVPAGIPERTPLEMPPTRLICVARLNEWKGQEVLIDAVALLVEEGHDVRLELVGGVYGDQHHFRTTLERRVAHLGLAERVALTGERRDALERIADSDIFVLPSRRPEPFGMALVEAMALGRPVVATDAGGPREIVTPGVDGLLVAPGSARALADAVEQLMADPDGTRAMAGAARRAASRFSISAMRRQVVEMMSQAHHERSSS